MRYVLKLFVTGKGSVSVEALISVKRLCEDELTSRYELRIIDVLKEPELAELEEIETTPTLIREEPGPVRRIVGDLSDRDRIRAGLQLDEGARKI